MLRKILYLLPLALTANLSCAKKNKLNSENTSISENVEGQTEPPLPLPQLLTPEGYCSQDEPMSRENRPSFQRLSQKEISGTLQALGYSEAADLFAQRFPTENKYLGFDNFSETSVIGGSHVTTMWEIALEIAPSIAEALLTIKACEESAEGLSECQLDIMQSFYQEITGISLNQEALTKFNSVATSANDFKETLQLWVTYTLQVSDFFYRSAKGDGNPDSPYLTQKEIADAITLYLTSAKATSEQLSSAENLDLRKIDDRLKFSVEILRSEAGQVGMKNFLLSWLNIKKPDNYMIIPDETLRNGLYNEMNLLLAEFLKRNVSVKEMLTAEYSFWNNRIHTFYTRSGGNLQGFEPVDGLGEFNHAGVLSKGAFLNSHTSDTESRVLFRGLSTLASMLCYDTPPSS